MEQTVTLAGAASSSDPAPFSIHVTEAAVKMAKVMMQREGLTDAALRISVSGGGCSGMQYHLSFDSNENADDLVVDHGVRVVVDAASRSYLNGMTLDYVNALHGAGFKFLNPNAERTCGCGTSFSVG